MSLDVNECLAKPCRNGGTCKNTVGSYTCACVAGWKGHDCEQGKWHAKIGANVFHVTFPQCKR